MIARALAAKAMQDAAGASEKEPLIVTFTVADPDTLELKADTPYADIVVAANAGRIVYAFVPAPVGPAFMQLSGNISTRLMFNAINYGDQLIGAEMTSDSNILIYSNDVLCRNSGVFGTDDYFDANNYKIGRVREPTALNDAATKGYVDNILTAGNSNSVIIKSSTPNSTKKFRITVDDAGAITATEVV